MPSSTKHRGNTHPPTKQERPKTDNILHDNTCKHMYKAYNLPLPHCKGGRQVPHGHPVVLVGRYEEVTGPETLLTPVSREELSSPASESSLRPSPLPYLPRPQSVPPDEVSGPGTKHRGRSFPLAPSPSDPDRRMSVRGAEPQVVHLLVRPRPP